MLFFHDQERFMNMNIKYNFSIWASAVLRALILTALVGLAFLKLSPVRAAGTVYDDTDAGWTYTGSWVSASGLTGPYANTFTYSGTVGNSASFSFTGTQFILKYLQYTNRGSIAIYVDNAYVTTVNQNGALEWQKTYTSPVYSSGPHTVRIEHAAGGTGPYVDIDAIVTQ